MNARSVSITAAAPGIARSEKLVVSRFGSASRGRALHHSIKHDLKYVHKRNFGIAKVRLFLG
jgi:hypothetical protein